MKIQLFIILILTPLNELSTVNNDQTTLLRDLNCKQDCYRVCVLSKCVVVTERMQWELMISWRKQLNLGVVPLRVSFPSPSSSTSSSCLPRAILFQVRPPYDPVGYPSLQSHLLLSFSGDGALNPLPTFLCVIPFSSSKVHLLLDAGLTVSFEALGTLYSALTCKGALKFALTPASHVMVTLRSAVALKS